MMGDAGRFQPFDERTRCRRGVDLVARVAEGFELRAEQNRQTEVDGGGMKEPGGLLRDRSD
jgi:hypothetical protein